MRKVVVNKETYMPLSFEEQKVFSKLLEIRGPKRFSIRAEERWREAYYKAKKDFEEIFGYEPELLFLDMEEDQWKRFESQ